MSIYKRNIRVQKLADKISISKTPVPGFVVGLSGGTDSIVTFTLLYQALKIHNKEQNLIGLNVNNTNLFHKAYNTYKALCPKASLSIMPHCVDSADDLWYRLREASENAGGYWIAATVNATEKYLGTYEIEAKAASIWPIATLWKTDVLNICKELNVPDEIIQSSKIPDCICGRDELAAENIELIDEIIQHKVDPRNHDPVLLHKLIQWVYDTKQQYDFKDRTPYII